MGFIEKKYEAPTVTPPLKSVEISCVFDINDKLVVAFDLGTIDIQVGTGDDSAFISLDRDRTDALILALEDLRERFE